jgi:amino acid transporter
VLLEKHPGRVLQTHTDDFIEVPLPDPLDHHIVEQQAGASAPSGGPSALGEQVQRTLFGRPIAEQMAAQERLNPVRALAILSSDALSSVAYGTEASLAVLLAAGANALGINLWIGLAIAALMIIVGNSYRQTVFAYPYGGGSYTVARKNLGTTAGLVAAASLSVDYILTVSVSVAAGIQALASAFHQLYAFIVPLDLVAIVVIVLINLRGVREAGSFFAIPTYLFLGSFGLMLVAGIVRAVTHGGFTAAAAPPVTAGTQSLTVMLVLTAFASGCSAMTGVEAISNGVPIFTGNNVAEQSRNAARTLVTMIAILVTFFLATTYLAWRLGIAPNPLGHPTVTAQIAQVATAGWLGWLFYVVQLATLLILVFAANTSFAGFPRLAAILAHDRFLPPFFAYRGERLAYNTGIFVLSGLSALILLAFRGNVADLINLYALGVFTSFTLSQIGMVRHWQRQRATVNARGWRIFSNGLGAVTTGVVTVVIAVAKFDRGAWVVVVLVPLLVLAFHLLRRYYSRARVFQVAHLTDQHYDIAIVPIFDVRDIRPEITLAHQMAAHVIGAHVVVDDHEATAFLAKWDALVPKELRDEVELKIVLSPYRTVVRPLARFAEWHAAHAGAQSIALLLPQQQHEVWWEFFLHRRVARHVRAILQREDTDQRITVINLPYTLGKVPKNLVERDTSLE